MTRVSTEGQPEDPQPDGISPPILDSVGAARTAVWGFWATLGFTLASFLAHTAAQAVVLVILVVAWTASGRGVDLLEVEGDGFFLSLAVFASTPVLIGSCWLFAWLRRGMAVREYLGLVPVKTRRVFRWCIVLLLFAAASDGLTASLGRTIVPEVMVTAYRTARFEPLLWIAIVLLGPLAEEVLFRGFLFRGLERSRVGVWGAVGISAVLWAVIHVQYDFYGMASIFAGGILLGHVRHRTGSILPTIILHALMNLIATVQLMVLVRWYGLPDG